MKALLGSLVAAMLTLTGVVVYSHFVSDSTAQVSAESPCSLKSNKGCGSCCTQELPTAACSEAPSCDGCKELKGAKIELIEAK